VWAHVAYMREIRNVYRILVGKPERKYHVEAWAQIVLHGIAILAEKSEAAILHLDSQSQFLFRKYVCIFDSVYICMYVGMYI
jgi:hypothetical protein